MYTLLKCFLISPPLQSGQHSFDPRNGPGPGEANPPRDRQQQRASAHAEHQRWIPVTQNAHPSQRWRETQQGAIQTEIPLGRRAPRPEINPHNMPCLFCRQAAILQQTAEYIFTLEQEKTRLLQQNSQLKRIIQVNCRHTLKL